MRAVIQRVRSASVTVDGARVSEIKKGILVLLGVERGDEGKDADYLAEKIAHLRIFEDDAGKMNRSLLEIGGELLIVSQFTLLGDTRKGRRPSFVDAEEPARAEDLYGYFIESSRRLGIPTCGGVFKAMMDVHLINDGPVTFIMESK